MFTGLVEEIGQVINISNGKNSAEITIEAKKILEGIKLGDSIAVNGVCVTVTKFTSNIFIVDVMAETLRMSNLNYLKAGSSVNLERAMLCGERFGGHIVSGHIDGYGKITDIKQEDIATWITIETPSELLKYIILKGSVALDGVSLTVAKLERDSFKVSLIPHTKGKTTLYYKKLGEKINIECDVVGKYVERLLSFEKQETKVKSKIDEEFLLKVGFM